MILAFKANQIYVLSQLIVHLFDMFFTNGISIYECAHFKGISLFLFTLYTGCPKKVQNY